MSFVTPSTSDATSSPNVALHVLQRGRRVLDGVVQQRGAQRLGVEPHAGADLRHADRVDDELLARLAPLVGVVLAGVDERPLDVVAVDLQRALGGVLLDDREQVAEQLALGVGEPGAVDRAPARRGWSIPSTGRRCSSAAASSARRTAADGGRRASRGDRERAAPLWVPLPFPSAICGRPRIAASWPGRSRIARARCARRPGP